MSDDHAYPVSPARRFVKRLAKPASLTKKSTTHQRGGDLTSKASPLDLDEAIEGLEIFDMATSFLQHCAFCEHQIMHPSNNMLYCSQACCRKDTNKPMCLLDTYAVFPSSPPPSSPRAVLAASTPTGTSYMDCPASRIPAAYHNAKADLDPTEWKPKRKYDIRKSEAFAYLSQFHHTSTAIGGDHEKIDTARSCRHRSHTSITSITSMMTTPSLASTPTTATSSLSMDYDFTTRALPPRHNPLYSASAGMTKDIRLVTPQAMPDAIGLVPEDKTWEKKPLAICVGGEKNSLLSRSMVE